MSYIPCNICGGGVPGVPCVCHIKSYRNMFRSIEPAPPLGWTCPKCARVWAPHMDGCRVCNPMPIAVAAAGDRE